MSFWLVPATEAELSFGWGRSKGWWMTRRGRQLGSGGING